VLCAQVAVLHVGQSMIVPILPLYARTFDVGPALVGVLLAAQSVPRIFVNVPAGRLADSLGAHRLLAFSCGVAMVGAVGSAIAPTFLVLVIARVLQGVASAISHTAGLTYAASLGGAERRGRQISLYQGSFLLGNGIGPVLGGVLAQHYGYRVPFAVFAVVSAVAGLWIMVQLPDPRGNEPAAIQARTDGAVAFRARDLLLHTGIMLACSMALLSAYTRSGSRDFALVSLSDERGLTEGQIGTALSLVFLATVAVMYGAGAMTDRHGAKAVMLPSWLLVAIGLAVLATADGYLGLLIAAAIYGVGAGVGNSVPAVHIANAVAPERRGMALGVFRTFSDLGQIIGPLVMGVLAGTVGLVWGVWLNVGVVLLAAVAYQLFGPPAPPRRRTR
jgi:MFS transporter, DHA1 family, multidrug resistance protein